MDGMDILKVLNKKLLELVRRVRLKGVNPKFKEELMRELDKLKEEIRGIEREVPKEFLDIYFLGKTIGRVEGVLVMLAKAEVE
ncbi:MAG: hypothetical protein NZ942_02900 [Candidatus Aenigmarchaeota archaeon]|nr:hypothetical protein [Candidatus Aenigmarchaeota archaeon]